MREKWNRTFGAKAAEAALTTVPNIIGGAARPLDEALDKAGIARGTGIADAMQSASEKIAANNMSDPGAQGSWEASFGSGAGSSAAFVATGAIGTALKAGAVTTSAIAGALQNAESFYRDAVAHDRKVQEFGGEPLPEWKKALAYFIGAGLGAT